MKVDAYSLSRDPAWIATFLTVLISTWIIISDDLINNDGVLYIEVASKYLEGNWQGAIEQYSWSFYSLLIALVSKISFLGLETSAYVLDVLLQCLLVFVFVRSTQAMGGSKRVAMMAAVLLLTNVTLNGYRDLIIRDFGYWAFFFTAFLCFLNFYRTRLVKYAVGFGLGMIVATLFRIEGIAFLVAAPFITLFDKESWKTRFYNYLKLSSVLIFVVVLCALYVVLTDSVPEYRGRLNDPLLYLQSAYQNLTSGIAEKGRMIEDIVLPRGSRHMGTESMLAILLMFLVAKIISAIGYIPLIFSVSGSFSRRIRSAMTGLNVVTGFMLINLLILIAFTLSQHFLSSRYTMCLALLMTLPAAFALADFFEKSQPAAGEKPSVWKRRSKIVIVIVLIYMLLDGLTSFSAGKGYVREAGLWMKENIPQQARLITSERALYYYAGRPADNNAIELASLATQFSKTPEIDKNNYDYLAIVIKWEQTELEQELVAWAGNKPVYRSANRRGDTLVIFALKQ